MGVKWTQNLAVGVENIDQQHKTLFEKVDQLFEAGKNGKSKEQISQLLDFLDEYTKIHFKDEEKYMLSIKYPEYDAQKKLHEGFIAKLSELKKDYHESGANITVILKSNQFVLDWLVQHISNADKKIGDYAKKNNLI